MINFNFTEEDLEVLRKCRNKKSTEINQLLVSNGEIDLSAILSLDEYNEDYDFYTKSGVEDNIKLIKDLYSIMLKAYYKKSNREA